jgi:Na+/proline symporter
MSCPDPLSTSVPQEYQGQFGVFGGQNPLPEGSGWAVVLGCGLFFSVFITGLLHFKKSVISSEYFNTAGHRVGTGLTASVIVAKWIWTATVAFPSTNAWAWGIAGPFWYAVGATIQIVLFGILAVEVKRKAPHAHTFCEIVNARWGLTAHKVFLSFFLLTIVLVIAQMIMGGANLIHSMTGMNAYACAFLIPMGTIAYTVRDGLGATFLASYFQSAVMMIGAVILCLVVYFGSDAYVGSASRMHSMLEEVANIPLDECVYGANCEYPLLACGGVEGNKDESYITILSHDALVFGIINVLSGFSSIYIDHSYWQSAIAARPASSYKGFLVGGVAWLAVPLSMGTALGLATVAMQLPVSYGEVGSGLLSVAAAVHMLGDAGATLFLFMVVLAVASTAQAEIMGGSSLIAYDVYRTYVNPQATGADILKVSRYSVVGFSLISGVLAVILNEWDLAKSAFPYYLLGIAAGPAVIPALTLLCWRRASAASAIAGALVGFVCGIVSWIIAAEIREGDVTVATLGDDYVALTGLLAAFISSGLAQLVVALIDPDDCDWQSTRAIALIADGEEEDLPSLKGAVEYDQTALHKEWAWGVKVTCSLSFVIVIAWPVLSIPAGVFSEGYFIFWAGLSILWLLAAAAAIIFMPVFESFGTLRSFSLSIFGQERSASESSSKKTAVLNESCPTDSVAA